MGASKSGWGPPAPQWQCTPRLAAGILLLRTEGRFIRRGGLRGRKHAETYARQFPLRHTQVLPPGRSVQEFARFHKVLLGLCPLGFLLALDRPRCAYSIY